MTVTSHDVAAGTAATLTCSVEGVSARDVTVVWVVEGTEYSEPSSDETNYSVV